MKNTFIEIFKVIAVSSNSNAFGLKSVILVTKGGIAYEVYANQLNTPKKDESICINAQVLFDETIAYDFAGYEVPTKLPNVPNDVLKEIFL